jgi:hypothetical protein
MTLTPPRTLSPTLTLTETRGGRTRSVRELNFIRPKRSPLWSTSPGPFQHTMRRASTPAICLQTTVTFSPSIVSAFCSLTRLASSFVAIMKRPFV